MRGIHAIFTSIELLTVAIISFTIVEMYELGQLKNSLIYFKLILPFFKEFIESFINHWN